MPESVCNAARQTQLGEKRGRMQLMIDGNVTCGYLNILERVEPCYGAMDENGFCTLHGQITAFMQTTHYIVNRTLDSKKDSKKISLSFHNGNDVFQVMDDAACGRFRAAR